MDWLPRIPSRFVLFFPSSSWNKSDSKAGRNDGTTSNRRRRHNNTDKTFCCAASPPWPRGIRVVSAQGNSSIGTITWWTMESKNQANVDLKGRLFEGCGDRVHATLLFQPSNLQLEWQFVKKREELLKSPPNIYFCPKVGLGDKIHSNIYRKVALFSATQMTANANEGCYIDLFIISSSPVRKAHESLNAVC